MIYIIKYEINSKKVKKGQTFIAIKGINHDGHDYIDEAIKNGASNVVSQKDIDINVPYIKVDDTLKYLKDALYREYKNIISKLNIIGITGTNGKTTSSYLTYQMLNMLGENTAYIGTLGYIYKEEHINLDNTTPDILNIYKLLIHSYEIGVKNIVMEVSSQALSYDRLNKIDFDIIGFTNLSIDHLDYHKTMDNYLESKLLILDHLKDNAFIVVNSDDEKSYKFKKENHNYFTFGYTGNYKINDYECTPYNTKLNFSYMDKSYDVTIPLACSFNVYNYLMMLSIVNNMGYSIDDIVKNTKDLVHPKGRCETYNINNSYAIIDYAHTPDAMEKIIKSYNKLKKAKLITIFGCGGNRDKTKRPIMGNIASTLSDYVIITNDNPRNEDENEIINDILKGIDKNNYEVILKRDEAIRKGINMLNENDILLILGKGHENYQIINDVKYYFDDKEEVLKYIK